jgi:cobyrinic acid a,c-diamide synthase
MVGAVSGEVFPTSSLQRFGYITMKAKSDNLLCKSGETIRAHEFHYWDSSDCGSGFTAEKSDGRTWDCCHVSRTLYAGFPHINFYSDISIAERFVQACVVYGEKK